jgi:hypothetical protein
VRAARNQDFIDRYARTERRVRWPGPDGWIDMGQYIDEGYLIALGAAFQRFQVRRVHDWVEMRGDLEWDGNSGNPDNPGGDYAESLVSILHAWSHGPLPEDLTPEITTQVAIPLNPTNVNVPAGEAATQAQVLQIGGNGEMLWQPIAAWQTVSPHFGFYGPLTLWNFDGCRYYVGEANDEEPPSGYVQFWPNP